MWYLLKRVRITERTHCVTLKNQRYRLYRLIPSSLILTRVFQFDQKNFLFFEYEKKKYVWNKEKKRFEKLKYPTSDYVSQYIETRGLEGRDIIQSLRKFGSNEFDIPEPTFKELFKEHAVAPFFVFQVFCVGLWFMDEYWYYSLFTLFMLFVFESTVVQQRLRNLKELRTMSHNSTEIFAFRNQAWTSLKSEDLVPGDVVSIVRAKSEDITVPCDLLILEGELVVNEAMLSGESTPLMKEGIDAASINQVFDIDSPDYKLNVLFGGTKVLQHTHQTSRNVKIPPSPDKGCIGYVLRTGFATTQGKLVRTMVFSTDRVSANNTESLLFILFLLVFALGAAYHVWTTGIANGRKQSKLLLDCVLIITSVVPPELPMELSLAVNQSLVALSRLAIFCLEPFRIPFAGKVDVCCFDKTGTLTDEILKFEGLAGIKSEKKILKASRINSMPLVSILSCHSLMKVDSGIVGDPMEKAAIDAVNWTVSETDVIVPAKINEAVKESIKIIRRFAFSSQLKRMACISSIDIPREKLDSPSTGAEKLFVSVKGAPEVLKPMFNSLPEDYEHTFKSFAREGSRVIALGWKWISCDKNSVKELTRESVECSLKFAGFLVFSSKMKAETKDAIAELQYSNHRIIMITGDNALTACHVAKELNIVKKNPLILDSHENELKWKSVDESIVINYEDSRKSPELLGSSGLCVTGSALESIENSKFYQDYLCHRVWVYARTSPIQKEHILHALKLHDYVTLMCGDGTNDVGALKHSDVGVALLNGTKEDLQKIALSMRKRRMEEMQKKQEEMFKSWGIQPPPQMAEQNKKQMQSLMGNMEDSMEEPPVLKFGDASVAAPFTSKLGTIMSICNILRQGRCTLVTTIQMYKILALNCLISAFTLSALYLDGIKYGDTQMTLQGFLIAGCFLFLSWGKPIERLSPERPQPNIFNLYILVSVLGQFFTHAVSLWYVVKETKSFLPPDWAPDAEDKEFEPNLLNTTVYLISLSMQVSTFLINYQGRPFRESISENKPLYYSLLSLLGVSLLGAAEIYPELNEWVQLVPMPGKFSETLVFVIVADLAICFGIEQACNWAFSNNKPKASLGL